MLVGVGLSIVIMLWGDGSPFAALPISVWARRVLNGALFGGTGAVIAYSAVGRISGAHINPAMTLAFWIEGKLKWRDALCYVGAQLAGAALGAALLLLWGRWVPARSTARRCRRRMCRCSGRSRVKCCARICWCWSCS